MYPCYIFGQFGSIWRPSIVIFKHNSKSRYLSDHVEIFWLFLKQYFTTLGNLPGFKFDCLSFQAYCRNTCILTCRTESLISPTFGQFYFHKFYFVWKLMTWVSRILQSLFRKFAEFCTTYATYNYEAEMRIFWFFLIISKLLNILQNVLHILIGNVKGLHKMYIKSYFDKNKFCSLLILFKFITQKWQSFCKCANFFADSFHGA